MAALRSAASASTQALAGGEYLVESIVDERKVDGTWRYLVKWLTYPSGENSWEPLSSFAGNTLKKLIGDAKFNKRHAAVEEGREVRASGHVRVNGGGRGLGQEEEEEDTVMS